MEINCQTLQSELAKVPLVIACDVVKDESFRLATPFTYPNGSHIDLFLTQSAHLFDEFSLNDFGQTAGYLMEIGFDPWQTKKRRQHLVDICMPLGVVQDSGAFSIPVGKGQLTELGHLMTRLAQACIRIADLSFTQRLQTVTSFDSEVEEFLAVSNLEYEPEPELIGKYGVPVKITFAVKGQQTASLVQTLSTRNPSTSHVTSVEVFRKWWDLRENRSEQFVTLFDSEALAMREDDASRLGEISTVLAFPAEQDQIAEVLAA